MIFFDVDDSISSRVYAACDYNYDSTLNSEQSLRVLTAINQLITSLTAIKRDSILAPPRRRKYGCSRDSERLRIKVGCMHGGLNLSSFRYLVSPKTLSSIALKLNIRMRRAFEHISFVATGLIC